MFTNYPFYGRVFGFYLIQFIAREILIYVLHCIICFSLEHKELHKNVIKAKWRKVKCPFVDKVFNYDLSKFKKD